MKQFLKNIADFLFAKEHLARTFWSFVVALLFFILGIWYNSLREPSKVFVTNTPKMQDTLVLRIEGQPVDADQAISKQIEQLAREVGSLRTFYSSTQRQSTSETKPIETSSASKIASSNQDTQPTRLIRVPLAFDPVLAPIKIPKFPFPDNIKGYHPSQLSSLARLTLPKAEYSKNEDIQLTSELLDPSILGKITPLIVDVLRKNSERSYTLLHNQQYVIQRGKNLVTLIADFGGGEFILEAGFFFVDDLNQEYPPRYRSQMTISVK